VIVSGRLNGSVNGVPMTVEADGREVMVRFNRVLPVVGAMRSLRQWRPPSGGNAPPLEWPEVRMKLGMLPTVRIL